MIHVEMFPGRSPEQKRALVKALTDAFVSTAGGAPQGVQVILREVDKSEWATAGVFASDRGS